MNAPDARIFEWMSELLGRPGISLCQSDQAGTILHASAAFARLTGRSADRPLNWQDILPPAEHSAFLAGQHKVLHNQTPAHTQEVAIVRQDASRVFASLTCWAWPHPAQSPRLLTLVQPAASAPTPQDPPERELRLQAALQAGNVATWEIDLADGKVRGCRALSELFGLPAIEMPLPPEVFLDRLSPQDRERVMQLSLDAVASVGHFEHHCRVETSGGNPRWLAIRGEALHDAQGKAVGLIGAAVDVTNHVLAQQALRESEERFRTLADSAQACVCVIENGRLAYSNRYLQELSGYSASELAELDPLELVHPEYRPALQQKLQDHPLGLPGSGQLECMMVTRTGQTRWLSVAASRLAGPAARGTIVVATDLTERKGVEQRLQHLNETLEQRVAQRTAEAEHRLAQLRSLSMQLAQAEINERQRLARVLHDHLQQLLFGAKLKLPVIRKGLQNRDVTLLQQVEDLLQQAISAARSLAVELSPPILYEAGLVPALRWLARWMNENHQLGVKIDSDDHAEPHADTIKVMLFQAVRELLFNVVKHAQVHQAQVKVATDAAGRVVVTVSDQGRGFDVQAELGHEASSFGLLSVRERVESSGGEMEILSHPGGGTSVTLRAPMGSNGQTSAASGTYFSDRADRSTSLATRVGVVLVSDHAIFRQGVRSMLREQDDLEILAECSSGSDAIEQSCRRCPSVVILDAAMQHVDAKDVVRRLVRRCPKVQIVALSLSADLQLRDALCEAGAAACLSRTDAPARLFDAIRQSAAATR